MMESRLKFKEKIRTVDRCRRLGYQIL